MAKYFLKKISLGFPTLLLVGFIVFLLIRMIPGDPAMLLAGDIDDPALLLKIRESLGLSEPLPVQFALWLKNILTGDFGQSIIFKEPVFDLVLSRFLVTFQLVVPAFVLAAMIGIPLGLHAAANKDQKTDIGIRLFVIAAISVPSFWVGMLLILAFGVGLQWVPIAGYIPLSDDFWQGASYLILPVMSLAFVEMASFTRMMRSATIETLSQDFITHAYAKGLSRRQVLYRHAFKNAFAPTLSLLGLSLGSLLAGAAVIETLFSIPGLGRLLVDSIYSRDYPMIQGCLIFIAAIYVSVNLCVDLLYPVFDPRVKL